MLINKNVCRVSKRFLKRVKIIRRMLNIFKVEVLLLMIILLMICWISKGLINLNSWIKKLVRRILISIMWCFFNVGINYWNLKDFWGVNLDFWIGNILLIEFYCL